MNRYHDAMERCAPPEGMRERLEERVLSARPERARTYRPRKRKAAVLLLAAALLLATGASVIWDPLFVRRFGPQAALSALGGAVFQEVDVTSVCDDVSLTVTQALCSDKTIHYILEYRLPEGAPQADYHFPVFFYYGTGDYTWEELRDACQEDWNRLDWTDYVSYIEYLYMGDHPLQPFELKREESSGSFRGEAEDGVLTFSLSMDAGQGVDLTRQPLTILVTPPYTQTEDGVRTAVTDHPAMITFQPAYDGPQALTGTFEEGGVRISATLSTFSLSLEAQGMGYPHYEDMVRDTYLIDTEGTEHAVSLMGLTSGGGSVADANSGEVKEVSTTVHFIGLTDTRKFTALRMGDYTVPLS